MLQIVHATYTTQQVLILLENIEKKTWRTEKLVWKKKVCGCVQQILSHLILPIKTQKVDARVKAC